MTVATTTQSGEFAPKAPLTPLLASGRAVIVGEGGMLHRAWGQMLGRHGIAFRSTDTKDLDLTRRETIAPAVAGASVVINCAAYTNVDAAETDEAAATIVNGTGVGWLAEACRDAGAVLVHYSTDYVFNGAGREPYRTDAPLDPLGAYGRSKAQGELLVRESGCPHLILRTSWLYAPWGKNFVRTIVRLINEGKALRIVDDQRGRPTSSEHLAAVTAALLDAGARGTLHATDGGECSWFEFAREIGRVLKPAGHPVDPCPSSELSRPAKRPAYSVLDLEPTRRLIGAMPSWQSNLASVLARLE